jgi:hypothetical protein
MNSFKYKINKISHFNLNQRISFWKLKFIKENGSHSKIEISGCDNDGHGDLCGLDRRSVIPYVHGRVVVLMCVLQARVALA